MSAFEFKYFDQQNKKLSFLQRQGETRVGSILQENKIENAKYVLIGIEESAGPQANFGRSGSENAFKAFLRVFLNTQVYEQQAFDKLTYLGKIVQKGVPLDQIEAAQMVHELDDLLFNILQEYLKEGQIPIIVGGGHNNALPLIRWAARNTPISVLNIDAHADLRKTEKRHSGNSFSTAMAEKIMMNYGVFGLHEAFNNQWIRTQLQHQNITHRFYEDYLQGPFQLAEDVMNFIQHQKVPIGLEIDMDAIAHMPSSAQSPSGWRLDEIRSLVYKIGHLKPPIAYLNLTEAAPQTEADDLIVGKALTYLVRDFIKATK